MDVWRNVAGIAAIKDVSLPLETLQTPGQSGHCCRAFNW
jgi:hypothetical protein